MKQTELTAYTTAELIKKKKMLQGILLGFTFIMLTACAVLAYLIFNSKKFSLIAVIPGCLFTLLPAAIVLQQIKKELKSRS